jgi:ferredoxin
MGPFHHHHSTTAFVRLNTLICAACWKCVDVCHKNALGKVDILGHRHARIKRADACAGCLKCVKACSSGALSAISHPKEVTMEANQTKRVFNKRAFTSIAMFVSAMILPISGIMNHELQFSPLTQERHFWMAVHNSAATLFAVFAVTHVTLNWKALIHYVKAAKERIVSRELIAAVSLVAIVVGMFASHALHVRY